MLNNWSEGDNVNCNKFFPLKEPRLNRKSNRNLNTQCKVLETNFNVALYLHSRIESSLQSKKGITMVTVNQLKNEKNTTINTV